MAANLIGNSTAIHPGDVQARAVSGFRVLFVDGF
jgi:hypothetical protein